MTQPPSGATFDAARVDQGDARPGTFLHSAAVQGPDPHVDPIVSLLAALDLTDTGARTSEDIFTGPSQWSPNGRVFGGQVLAQSLLAAVRTLAEDRSAPSMHGYFLRPGNVQYPITFSVDRIHDGRSF